MIVVAHRRQVHLFVLEIHVLLLALARPSHHLFGRAQAALPGALRGRLRLRRAGGNRVRNAHVRRGRRVRRMMDDRRRRQSVVRVTAERVRSGSGALTVGAIVVVVAAVGHSVEQRLEAAAAAAGAIATVRNRVRHRPDQVEHGVVALVGDARMQEATAHAPRALAARVEAADGFRFVLFGSFLVLVADFALFEFAVVEFAGVRGGLLVGGRGGVLVVGVGFGL